ncbi:5 - c-terminal domain-containing protein [Cystoisospora suis]|uniref:5-c-terminal domain-containing protein n=1 Tax=Cystoisospora suis TaxID=483139 RepID=A0A2C6KXE3_9APIC|nr:5 - c-terminal domain-containing protein [Cystoisospora suis]
MIENESGDGGDIMEKEFSGALQHRCEKEKTKKKTLYIEKEGRKNKKLDGEKGYEEEGDFCCGDEGEDFFPSSSCLTTKDSSYQSLVSGVDEGGGGGGEGGGDTKKKSLLPSHEQLQRKEHDEAARLLSETESLLSSYRHGSERGVVYTPEDGVYTPEDQPVTALLKKTCERSSPPSLIKTVLPSPCSSFSLSLSPTSYDETTLRKRSNFQLRIVHFNDVYNPLPTLHPSGLLIGGAPSFCTAVKEKKEGDKGLILFSGDIFSPSQISEMTKGRQMADLLNILGVHTACYGNHDLDYGWEWLEVLAGTTNCKWIMSNTWAKQEEGEQRGCFACNGGGVLANAQRYRIFEWGGGGEGREQEGQKKKGEEEKNKKEKKESRQEESTHQGRTRTEKDGDHSKNEDGEGGIGGIGGGGDRIDEEKKENKKKHERILIGIMGLIEEEWIDTLNPHDRDHIVYRDFVMIGKEMCEFFKRRGCDLIIALTHMRWNNDEKLAREVPDIDLILGGHDHEYTTKIINGVPIVKSGSDFREFSSITLYPAFQLREKGTAHMVPPRKGKEDPQEEAQEKKEEQHHSSASLSPHTISNNSSSVEMTGCTYTSESIDNSPLPRNHTSSMATSSTGASSIFPPPSPSLASNSLEEEKNNKKVNETKNPSGLSPSSSLLPHGPLSLSNFETLDEKEEPKKFYRTGRWYISCERVDVNKKSCRSCDEAMREESQGSTGVDASLKIPPSLAYDPDEEVFRMLSSYQSEYSLPENEVLGVFPVPLETRFSLVRREECNSGNWLTDIMREAFETDVALYNSGGIRSDCLFNKGEMITSETLNALLSGLRELCIIDVQGGLFKSILENSVSRYPQLEGRFLQISGLRFSFKPSEAVGHRVVEEEIYIYDRRKKEWMKVEETRLYSVILPRFLLCGGDGFSMFSLCQERPLKDDETVKKYLDLSVLTRFWLRYTSSHASSLHGVHTPEEQEEGGKEEENNKTKRRDEDEEKALGGHKRELRNDVDPTHSTKSYSCHSSTHEEEEIKKKKKSGRDFFSSFEWVHRVHIEEKHPDQWRIRKVE